LSFGFSVFSVFLAFALEFLVLDRKDRLGVLGVIIGGAWEEFESNGIQG